MLSGDNGILQRATDAKIQTGVEQEKETLSLAWSSCMVKKTTKNEDITDVQLSNELKNNGYNDVSVKKSGNKFKVTFSSGNVYTIKDDGIVQKYEKVKPTAVYAKLYTDGTLILSSTDYTDEMRTLAEGGNYGDVSGYTEYNLDNFFITGEHPGWMVSPLYNANSKITNVIIYDKISPTKIDGWFARTSVTSLDLRNLDTSNVTSMESLFMGCESLTNINLENLDTSNVTNMSYMFGSFGPMQILTSLDLRNFDTSNVTDMSHMFDRCMYLTNLRMNSFDTSNVTNMSYMFHYLFNLDNLDISGFNTSNVENMSGMFHTTKFKRLNLMNLNTTKVKNMESMFESCSELESLNLNSFNTSNVTNMRRMFAFCSKLVNLNLENFNTPVLEKTDQMFWDCKNLKTLDIINLNTSNVTNMDSMFMSCETLKQLDLSNFDTISVTNMSQMFNGCSGLITIYASDKFVTTSVTNSRVMFSGCTNLVGGTGANQTTYSNSKVTATMAKISTDGVEGYFTAK